MAKAVFIQNGDNLDYTNATDEEIGYCDVVPLASCIGVAAQAILPGATGTVDLTGVYELPADNATAFAVGDVLYWAAADNKLVKTKTGNVYAGLCFADKVAAGGFAAVKIG